VVQVVLVVMNIVSPFDNSILTNPGEKFGYSPKPAEKITISTKTPEMQNP
jgi:hypothetical protein